MCGFALDGRYAVVRNFDEIVIAIICHRGIAVLSGRSCFLVF